MAKRISFVLVAVLSVYLVFAFIRGFDLFKVGDWNLILLGICVMLLPILGAWLIIRELRFGYQSTDLGKSINPELLPLSSVKARSIEASQYLELAIARAKTNDQDWQFWYCLGIAYDLVGQRKLAREAVSHALVLASATK